MTTLRRRAALLSLPLLLTLAACSAPGAGNAEHEGAHSSSAPAASGAASADAGQAASGSTEGEATMADGAAQAAAILTAAGVTGADVSQPESVVDALEAIPVAQRPEGLAASVTAAGVSLQDAAGATAELGLDRFYLSMAPYITTTHECTFHAPVGCKGELSSTPVDVEIKDAATGEVLVKDTVTTANNGFAGFWLPRDRELSITASANGKSGTVQTGTGANDPTCLTTLRLS